MKKTKIMSLSIALALLFSCFIGINAAAAVFSDTAGPYETAIDVLAGIGLLQGRTETEFMPNDGLKRAEMATMLVRLLGMDDTAAGTDVFTDVPASHWAYKYVGTAYHMGIINGVGDALFAPDDALTYTQAVKMLVCALGYEPYAGAAGGYPSGYLAQGARLGLTGGVPTDEAMTRGAMAQLIYNALDVPLLQPKTVSGQAFEYEESDETILSCYLKITKIVGKVTADYMTNIGAAQAVREGEVVIDGTLFAAGETNAGAYIGQIVTAYAAETDDTPLLLTVQPKSASERIVINADEIDKKTTDSTLHYEKGSKAYSERIAGATVVYNGAVTTQSVVTLLPESGTVTIVKNAASTDLVIIDAYTDYVVDRTDNDAFKVFFMEAVNGVYDMTLDLTDTSRKISLTDKSGGSIAVPDLKKWDILSVAAGNSIRAIRSNERVEGKVTEMSADAITVSGQQYDLTARMREGGVTTLKKPTFGGNAVYCLNSSGKVAAVNTEQLRGYKYGYLIAAEVTKGLNAQPQIKVFTEDEEMQVYTFVDRVQCNGGKYARDTLLQLDALSPGGVLKPQLIRYSVNESGAVTELSTAQECRDTFWEHFATDSAEELERLDTFSLDMYLGETGKVTKSDGTEVGNGQVFVGSAGVGTFATRVTMNANTKVFAIPEADAADENYKMRIHTSFTYGTNAFYEKLAFYDVNETGTAAAVVYDLGSALSGELEYVGAATSGTSVGVITKIARSITESGEVMIKLNLLTNAGTEKSILVEQAFKCGTSVANTNLLKDPQAPQVKNGKRDPKSYTEVENLNAGDCVAFALKADGIEARAVTVLYRAETPGLLAASQRTDGEFNYVTSFYYYIGASMNTNGFVKKIGDTGIVVQIGTTNNAGQALDKNGAPVTAANDSWENYGKLTYSYPRTGACLLFDMRAKTAKKITFDELHTDDLIFSSWDTTIPKMLVAYRNYDMEL